MVGKDEFFSSRYWLAAEPRPKWLQPLAGVPKITLAVENGGPVATVPTVPAAPSGARMTVTIKPLEIRTWMCSTTPQHAATRGPAHVIEDPVFSM